MNIIKAPSPNPRLITSTIRHVAVGVNNTTGNLATINASCLYALVKISISSNNATTSAAAYKTSVAITNFLCGSYSHTAGGFYQGYYEVLLPASTTIVIQTQASSAYFSASIEEFFNV